MKNWISEEDIVIDSKCPECGIVLEDEIMAGIARDQFKYPKNTDSNQCSTCCSYVGPMIKRILRK